MVMPKNLPDHCCECFLTKRILATNIRRNLVTGTAGICYSSRTTVFVAVCCISIEEVGVAREKELARASPHARGGWGTDMVW